MTGEDWTNYATTPAPRTLLCQFRRKDRYFNHVGFAKDFLPEFNVAGLEWRLTGIAKEQLDRMPEEVRTRIFGWLGHEGGMEQTLRQSSKVRIERGFWRCVGGGFVYVK